MNSVERSGAPGIWPAMVDAAASLFSRGADPRPPANAKGHGCPSIHGFEVSSPTDWFI